MLSLALLFVAGTASAFLWVANLPGVDTSILKRSPQPLVKRQANATCPFNPDHPGAAPINPLYPYTGALLDGLPGTGIGGVQVPAPGDTAHYYTPPGPNDIRGPCPGMNTAANHNFLSHDGITNFAELVSAQQNLYNLDFPLAAFIAVRGIALDGDPVTQKISIGCDATSRTSSDGGLLGNEPGLDGHNKFEGDTSLTRDDYFLADGDNFSFNGTLFAEMYATANRTSNGLFDRNAIANYRSMRYDESLMTNPNFYFGPKSLLLYGAASFVYEVMPKGGPAGEPDIDTISTFFGAVDNGDGTYSHVPERIPDNWSNRATAYGLIEIGQEIIYQYSAFPKLLGGNAGVCNFDAFGTFGIIAEGMIPSNATAADIVCLLYQLSTENIPTAIEGPLDMSLAAIDYAITQLNPIFANYGCQLKINQK